MVDNGFYFAKIIVAIPQLAPISIKCLLLLLKLSKIYSLFFTISSIQHNSDGSKEL